MISAPVPNAMCRTGNLTAFPVSRPTCTLRGDQQSTWRNTINLMILTYELGHDSAGTPGLLRVLQRATEPKADGDPRFRGWPHRSL